ncbi:hypothetical protein CIG75_04810 [Tumebacillus algifaecis]|uniref:Uncharacterized protein n=1 Tax=Tumebacillus algifaecis TaxID=1214604 RepID=A0A223CYA3_9BACL|nr:hypothetical protein CIG75_04810 [Tumebacillus algifaecis]
MKALNKTIKTTPPQDLQTRFAVAFLTLFLATFFLGRSTTPQLGIGQIVLLWGLLVPDMGRVTAILFVIYYFMT